ncbi:MAG: SDR family oxidoreductase [Cytophagales bacterium]|nr:SDR family oxidoreductase [Cytophagales bacterium]
MKRTALITGASSGIGMELAREFAKAKNNLVLVARSMDKLQTLAKELEGQYGVTVHLLSKDLSKYEAAKEAFDWTLNEGITIDYLVNNAGFGDFGFFVESNWEKQLQMINLNITTLTYLTRLYLPGMVQRKYGKILNVASTAAFQSGPTMSVYYATKAFVLHFSEAIANELEGTGVTVTALCPGATESGFQSAAAMEESNLVKGKKLPTSKEVAEYGFKAMMKGKVVAIHGLMNYLMANSVRFTPRPLVVKITRMMQDKAH